MKNSKIIILEMILSFFTIITIIGLITVISLRVKAESQNIGKDLEASTIATNILENMNSRRYMEIETYIDELSVVGISKKIEENNRIVIVDGKAFKDKFFGTEIPENYIVELRFDNLEENFDIQKKVNIVIRYKDNEMLNISTILEREIVNNCNKPEITDTYFNPLGISLDEYEIIPIKYSYSKNFYVVTTKGDNEWYNYYSKEWAKVLVFPKFGEDLKNLFIDSNGNVKNQVKYDDYNLDINNYIYVWIPNFSVKDSISYFRYGNGKTSIKKELIYSNGEYLYFNTISEIIPDINNDCNFDGLFGVWKPINIKDDIYFSTFNSTRFGPLNLH